MRGFEFKKADAGPSLPPIPRCVRRDVRRKASDGPAAISRRRQRTVFGSRCHLMPFNAVQLWRPPHFRPRNGYYLTKMHGDCMFWRAIDCFLHTNHLWTYHLRGKAEFRERGGWIIHSITTSNHHVKLPRVNGMGADATGYCYGRRCWLGTARDGRQSGSERSSNFHAVAGPLDY